MILNEESTYSRSLKESLYLTINVSLSPAARRWRKRRAWSCRRCCRDRVRGGRPPECRLDTRWEGRGSTTPRHLGIRSWNKVGRYRVTHLLADLGWVDYDFGSSPGWWAATAATYCRSKMVQHPKSKSTQPRSASRCVIL